MLQLSNTINSLASQHPQLLEEVTIGRAVCLGELFPQVDAKGELVMLCKRETRKVDHNEHGHNVTLQMLCPTLVFLWTN